MSGIILPFRGTIPKISKGVFVAPNAHVIGDTVIGEYSSIWFSSTVRGDVNYIRIGSRSNIQDCSVVHVTRETGPTTIGDNVTIGHSAVIHACNIQSNCLIGMGACLLDGVVVENNAMVAAGALVTPGKKVPSGKLWAGRPAKFMRDLSPTEIVDIEESASHYCHLAAQYIDQ